MALLPSKSLRLKPAYNSRATGWNYILKTNWWQNSSLQYQGLMMNLGSGKPRRLLPPIKW